MAVQIAKASSAEVTSVASTPNLNFLRALGTDHVIDYRTTDFTRSGQASVWSRGNAPPLTWTCRPR